MSLTLKCILDKEGELGIKLNQTHQEEKVVSNSATSLSGDAREISADEVVTDADAIQQDSELNMKRKQIPRLMLQRVSVSRHQMNRLPNSASSIENELLTERRANTAAESKKPLRDKAGKSGSKKSLRDAGTSEKDRVKFTKGTHSNTDAKSVDSASNGKSGESNEVSTDTNEESPGRTFSKSSRKPNFKNDQFVNSLDPEVLEAVHEDCDLKECITCKYCQQPFSITSHGIRYFVKHIVTHTGKPVIDKPFKCSDCNANFKASFEVHQHKIYHHGVSGNYKCQECGKTYNKRNTLYKHMRVSHRTKNTHIVMCEQCGQEVPKTRLKTHMSRHTGIFAIHCQVSGCKFKTNENRYLDQHMARSHKPKSDLCRFCGLSFPLQGALAAHERKHLNSKPIIHKKYRCDECGFSTDIISELSKHKRRHKKEFRFKCRHCDKKFQQRSSCKRHIPYCQKQLGLPVDDVKSAKPVDLFVRKRKLKLDQKVETVEFPVAIEKMPTQEGQPMNVQHFPEDSIPFTVASVETIPVTSTAIVDEPAVEIATAIANLQFMQS